MMGLRVLVLSLLLSWVSLVNAAAPAVVDSVQAPAWLERGGNSLPLMPGQELKSGDVVRTGVGARAYLALAEGSMVKLGESARFVLYSRSLRPELSFKGALDIASGAFRFTTDVLRRSVAKRELTIRVATATIGIRGTDVWGKATAERDLVALLEGKIELTRAGQSIDLQPMSYLDAPRGGIAEIKSLDPAQFRVLARETEIEAGDGALRRGGAWKLSLGEFASQEEALERYDRLASAGFASRLRPLADGQGGWHYELRVAGYASEAEAKAAAGRVSAVAGGAAKPVR